jgi:hypothetical protein
VTLCHRILCTLLFCCIPLFAKPVAKAGPFEFHSNFWLNLHHFLYEQALHKSPPPPDLAKAVEFYRRSMVSRDLLFDLHMRSIDTELAEDETLPKLVVAGEDAALYEALNSTAAAYRAQWWTTHDQANRTWIAAAVPLVQQYAPQLMKQLATVYEVPWPKDLIRVDVSEYANWAGAYTYSYSWNRVHEIISSVNDGYRGYAALEMLFHEATHGMVPADSGRLADAIAKAAKANRVTPPKDLLHIFIFYTAGELTKRDLANDYVPYAEKKGLYRGSWVRWHGRIQNYWKQHLDGTLSLDEAVNKIVVNEPRPRAK